MMKDQELNEEMEINENIAWFKKNAFESLFKNGAFRDPSKYVSEAMYCYLSSIYYRNVADDTNNVIICQTAAGLLYKACNAEQKNKIHEEMNNPYLKNFKFFRPIRNEHEDIKLERTFKQLREERINQDRENTIKEMLGI